MTLRRNLFLLSDEKFWHKFCENGVIKTNFLVTCALSPKKCAVPSEIRNKAIVIKNLLSQLVRSVLEKYWSSSFFASLWTSPAAQSINLQKKNSTNISQYGPHPSSITSIY